MISHELKFIFIHIPKTSGNSLSLFLKNFISNKVIQRKSLIQFSATSNKIVNPYE